MNKDTFALLENYMCSCMDDSAHDKEHIYRVLYHALEIAESEKSVDYDILICACLLHDIGRSEQLRNPSVCHAMIGGEMAYSFLLENNFSEEFAGQVRHCVQTHRFRQNRKPETIEAKILFDADKLDVSGAMGVARTLLYQGNVSDPLYWVMSDGTVSDGTDDARPSFFREYNFKLQRIYDQFYTSSAAKIASRRRGAAVSFYRDLLNEVTDTYHLGTIRLTHILEE